MNSKAASTTDLMETLNLKQVKTNLEVQLSGIKVPTRRAVDEARMLVGLKLVKSETLGRSGSKGRGDSPSKRKPAVHGESRPAEARTEGPPQMNRLMTGNLADDEAPRQRSKGPGAPREPAEGVLKRKCTDTGGLADDEGRAQRTPQRAGRGLSSRLQQRAKVGGLNVKVDCKQVVEETTETFTDASEHYDMLEQLGRGAVATVKKAVRKKDGLVVALKIAGSRENGALVEAEFKMLQTIKHPSIIHALDYFNTNVSAILVLEYFDGSSLEVAVCKSSRRRFPEITSRELFRSLLSAVCYLHSRRIIHRDIKPSNVLVSDCLRDLRLLDFNVAKRLTEGGALTTTGTRLYFAPEVINGEPALEANDVWGCGLCVFFMLAGRLPWKNLPDGVFVDHPALKVTGTWCRDLSEPCKSVIRQCLAVDPAWRPPAMTIVLHEWFWAELL
ncbi:unnamed protein product, partial [Effrenium voratum]